MPTAPAPSDPTGVRAAEAEANRRAEAVAADRSVGYVPNVGQPPAQPAKVSHQTKMRPADSGYVNSSPAELAERMGKYAQGGEQVFLAKAEAPQMAVKGGSDKPAELISHEGVPDLPALRKHNAQFADSMEQSILGQSAVGDTITATTATANADLTGGDRSNTIEGVIGEKVEAATEKAEEGSATEKAKKG